MAYIIENGIWNSVFAVPTEIVDKHLKLCGATSLKVLLVLLRGGAPMEPAELARYLNLPVIDIQDAMNYWVHLGVIRHGEQQPPPAPSPVLAAEPSPPALPAPPAAGVVKISSSRQKLTTQEINEMAETDENVTYLLQETQSVLGKPLTPVATDTVVSLYSYYGMLPDLILMLVHYCVSIGKGNMRYIEKVAASWLENGIDTHEKAEREIVRATQSQNNENKIKSMFGIHDRNLITSEKAYIKAWLEDYKMGLPIIQFAFERTVELKGKLNFAYINGILANWHQKGVTTPAQAAGEIRRGDKSAPKSTAVHGSSYEMDELELMIDKKQTTRNG